MKTVITGRMRSEEDINGNRTNNIPTCQAREYCCHSYSTRFPTTPCLLPMISVAIFVGTSA